MVEKIITILYALIEAAKRIVKMKKRDDIRQELKDRDDEKTRKTLDDLIH